MLVSGSWGHSVLQTPALVEKHTPAWMYRYRVDTLKTESITVSQNFHYFSLFDNRESDAKWLVAHSENTNTIFLLLPLTL